MISVECICSTMGFFEGTTSKRNLISALKLRYEKPEDEIEKSIQNAKNFKVIIEENGYISMGEFVEEDDDYHWECDPDLPEKIDSIQTS